MTLRIRLRTLLIAACIAVALSPVLLMEALNYWEQAGDWGQRAWLMAAVGALGVALAIAVGRWVAGVLERPLDGLLSASGRLARGENEARVSAPRGVAPVEVLQLIDRFNHLADHLLDTHHALADAKADLEQRVTERTQELAQRNVDLGYSRTTLYAVMESMNDGVVLITPDRRIRYINRNTESLLRLEEAFYPGRPADALYRAIARACVDPEGICEPLKTTLAAEAGPALLTVEANGDTKRYLQWRTFPIRNATGADLGLGHILTDVTQAHELDRIKSEVISTVSHELRTPLTAIRASVSSLLRQGVEWDEETRQDFLLTIHEESRHLQELIENVLDMSKIEAGVLRLELYPMAIGDLVEGVVNRVRPLHPDWTLTAHIPPGLPAVSMDRRRMEQVLLNLVDNAVKYAAESREIAIGAWQDGREVWLSVRDEGIGIPQEHVNLIFQRFHRVDSKLTRNTGGSGLGLAISRGLVEAHGGRIWVESALGEGSTFFIALPVTQEANPV